MRAIRIPVMAAALLLAGWAGGAIGAAQAQTMSYAQAGALLAKSCGPDINKFCSNVNLGNGAVQACMQANISKVSQKCKVDFAVASASIAEREAAQDSIAKVCGRDAAQLCQGMLPEDGNLLSCLLQAEKVVSKACNAAITNAGYR
ncbi:MAG: cysteine rich repeat-containing protein [Xanthobacter sp.]